MRVVRTSKRPADVRTAQTHAAAESRVWQGHQLTGITSAIGCLGKMFTMWYHLTVCLSLFHIQSRNVCVCVLCSYARPDLCAVCKQEVTLGTRPARGEPRTGSAVGEGEKEKGREHPGGFHGAGQDVKVMSLSIRSAGPSARVGCVPVREHYHEMLSRHPSISLFLQLRLSG